MFSCKLIAVYLANGFRLFAILGWVAQPRVFFWPQVKFQRHFLMPLIAEVLHRDTLVGANSLYKCIAEGVKQLAVQVLVFLIKCEALWHLLLAADVISAR